jgi:hypothetical protein
MKKQLTILLLSLAFAFPALAQEATEAPAASPDVTVVVEAPAEAPTTVQESNRFLMAIALVSLLINALQAFLSHKSIPADLAKQIFGGARFMTKLTADTRDDELVDTAEKVYNSLAGATEPAPATEVNVNIEATSPKEAVG